MAKKRTPKNSTIALLRAVNQFLASLHQSDVDDILSGRLELSLRSVKPSHSLKSDDVDPVEAERDFQVIIDELVRAEDTKSGIEILQATKLTKVDLEKIARMIDVPVLKQDAALRLEEKILEALVGSRLNSRAIRGNQ